jgi:hypothetical protein
LFPVWLGPHQNGWKGEKIFSIGKGNEKIKRKKAKKKERKKER